MSKTVTVPEETLSQLLEMQQRMEKQLQAFTVQALEVMNESEAAVFLRMSVGTLRNWRSRGTGPQFIVDGGVKYLRKTLVAWMEGRQKQITHRLRAA